MEINPEQIDAISEIINIGMGYAASTLNDMVGAHVDLNVPHVVLLSPSEIESELTQLTKDKLCMTTLSFLGNFEGTASLVFPNESAVNLVSMLTGEEPGTPDLDTIRAGTLHEVGNIIVNSIMGSIANTINSHLEYSLPDYLEDTVANVIKILHLKKDYSVVYARIRLSVQSFSIQGDLILIFSIGSLEKMLEKINDLI